MDFLQILKSVEELLYELVALLLFYPLTLWRSLKSPAEMMIYAEDELTRDKTEQFSDTLSPPIFLLITLFLVHVFELVIPATESVTLPNFLQDKQNLILFRAVAISIFPLMFAVGRLRRGKMSLNRQELKPQFYGQCYVTAPFALMLSSGFIAAGVDVLMFKWIGVIFISISFIWYVWAQALILKSTESLSYRVAILVTLWTVSKAILLMLGISMLPAVPVILKHAAS